MGGRPRSLRNPLPKGCLASGGAEHQRSMRRRQGRRRGRSGSTSGERDSDPHGQPSHSLKSLSLPPSAVLEYGGNEHGAVSTPALGWQ